MHCSKVSGIQGHACSLTVYGLQEKECAVPWDIWAVETADLWVYVCSISYTPFFSFVSINTKLGIDLDGNCPNDEHMIFMNFLFIIF